MKTCSQCGIEKDLAEFAFKNKAKGTRSSYCKSCQNDRSKAHYKANRASYSKRVRDTEAEIRAYLIVAKSVPCKDCGKTYPHYVMHFDHLRDKSFNISRKNFWTALKRVMDEVAKCEVVCSNCHAERTAMRAGYSCLCYGM